MRAILIACAVIVLPVLAHSEDMVGIKENGLMCRNEKALADLTAPDGTVKQSAMLRPNSAASNEMMSDCKDDLGEKVHVVTKRKNTSIVTDNGQTWYVPNIDFMTPSADCIKDGTKVTMTGTIESAFAQTDESDPKKGYHYPRLTLDKPACFLGNTPEKDGKYVSLPSTSIAGNTALMKLIGKHVSITGEVGSPDNGNQPPDPMMMFDPKVTPAG